MSPFPLNPDAPILIVDDEFFVLLGLQDALEDMGFKTIITAATMQEGLDVLREQRPEFAFLDVNLGREKSLDLARALQSVGVPFAFVTGYDRSVLEGEFMEVAILSKPLHAAVLGTVVAVAET